MINIMQKNRLYGRTRGRSNKKVDIIGYNKLVEEYKLNKLNFKTEYILDIGTGYGETSVYLANNYKNKTIISCEKYIDGNINLLKDIKIKKIQNIKLHPGNVHEILDNNPKKKYFGLVWIFFPDPWPKKKHFKRRLVCNDFLKKIYHFMKLNGEIHIVTDSESYIRFILNAIHDCRDFFKWLNQNQSHLDLKDYYKLETKYYKKAIISGRNPLLFILKKI